MNFIINELFLYDDKIFYKHIFVVSSKRLVANLGYFWAADA